MILNTSLQLKKVRALYWPYTDEENKLLILNYKRRDVSTTAKDGGRNPASIPLASQVSNTQEGMDRPMFEGQG